jgi:putative FmdB family regulatory protein
MPIYEYTCESCQTRFDRLIKSMTKAEPVHCPKCGSPKTARALSVFAVGAESAKSPASPEPGLCGRCGGPGPCGMN